MPAGAGIAKSMYGGNSTLDWVVSGPWALHACSPDRRLRCLLPQGAADGGRAIGMIYDLIRHVVHFATGLGRELPAQGYFR